MRIMVPVGGTRDSEEAVPLAVRLANSYGAELYLLRVIEATDAFNLHQPTDVARMVEDARGYLYDLAHRWELTGERIRCLVSRTGDRAKGIVDTAKATGIDLIIMASHGRDGTHVSVCDEVIRSNVCPDTPVGRMVAVHLLADAATKAPEGNVFPTEDRQGGDGFRHQGTEPAPGKVPALAS